jgi:hypothetical protein
MKILKNKKAGEFISGLWIILIIFYFSIFVLIVNSSQNVMIDTALNDTYKLDNINLDVFNEQYKCDIPRFSYNPNTFEEKIEKQSNHLDCSKSYGVFGRSECSNIQGCEWNTTTIGMWWWKDEITTCVGTINYTYYDIEVETFPLNPYAKPIVANYEFGLTYFKNMLSDNNNICRHPSVINNITNCNLFSCSWVLIENDENVTYKTILNSVSDIFTFRYDFGFTNDTIKYIMNFIFIILPLLILIIAVYFAIPVIH